MSKAFPERQLVRKHEATSETAKKRIPAGSCSLSSTKKSEVTPSLHPSLDSMPLYLQVVNQSCGVCLLHDMN